MSTTPQQPQQPEIRLTQSDDYRERYANSVQVRASVWDFCIYFGTVKQTSENSVEVQNHEAIFLSPQQAKALYRLLEQNVQGYEQTFGEIALEPRQFTAPAGGPRPV
jgi:Protein of unknown function (DUF3467)